MKIVVWGYASVISIIAIWAWYVDIKLINSPVEHLLPDIMLSLASLPMSMTLGPMYSHWPIFFDKPFIQLTWLTVCGYAQVTALNLFEKLVSKRLNHA